MDDMAGVGPASPSATWGQLAASNASACAPLKLSVPLTNGVLFHVVSIFIFTSVGVCKQDRCMMCPGGREHMHDIICNASVGMPY